MVFEDPDQQQDDTDADIEGAGKGGLVTLSIFAAGILLLIVLLYFAY